MIGEIRDLETAQIAVQASLTGHLVLATLHTNDAVGSVARLVDMGVEPFLVASSLLGVLAQRLVRPPRPACANTRAASAWPTSAMTGCAGYAAVTPASRKCCVSVVNSGKRKEERETNTAIAAALSP